jgi:phospholipase C
MSGSRLKYRAVFCCFTSIFLIILCGCGGGRSSSSFPTGSVQLSVQATGGGGGTVSSNPAGINCGQTCTASFSSGTQVTLTASPAANSFFAGWSGACSGTGACQVTLMQSASVMANFSTSPVLTVALTGQGTVTSTPSGINCGQTCSANFASGTAVTLTATAGANSSFVGWSGGGCSGASACVVKLSASQQVTATFNINQNNTASLTVVPQGTGTGTVMSSPSGINCGTTCSASFSSGTQVTLTATAAAGSIFAGWGGACSGANSTCQLTLTSNVSVTATFTNQPPPTLTVTLAGTGAGTVSSSPAGISCQPTCSSAFPLNSQVQLTAATAAGSNFAGWTGACTGTNSSCTVTMTGNQQVGANFTLALGINVINHIIFLAQENRSFDHYFGALREYWTQNGYPDQQFDGLPQFNPGGQAPTNPGCNPADPPPDGCVFDPTNPITSYHLITQCIENPSPSWNEAHVDWDYNDHVGNNPATLNGFVNMAAGDARVDKFYDVDGIRAMGYYDGGDLNYYYFMASNFATSDRWFHPAMTRTHPNREYLVASTSQGYIYPVGTDSKDKALLTAPTIFQELQAANPPISWKIYVDPGSVCPGPPYDPHCLITLSYLQFFEWGHTIPDQYPGNIGTIGFAGSDYDNDLAKGTLPSVALIEPATDSGYDEHPSVSDSEPNDIQRGANYVATKLINPLMASTSWKDSAFILTWDENGGLYDHVSPQPTVSPDGIPPVDFLPGDICTQGGGPTCDFVYTGYRVPLIVVSPYTRQNYVSHTVTDATAILKFIETRFNLPALTQRDAAQMDMTEFFDFTNPVWLTPPSPPVQNTNGACYLNKLP